VNGQFLDHVVDFRHAMSVRVTRTRRTTIASICDGQGRVLAEGVAKRRKTDVPCRAVGDTFAYARALADLSRHYFELASLADQINSGALEGR
jgi:hypothetical protein